MSVALLILIPFSPAFAQEMEATPRVQVSAPEPDAGAVGPRYELEFDMEVRAQRDQRERPQNRSRESLHELTFGGRYRFDPRLAVRLDLAVEQLDGESEFFAKQAIIDWTPWLSVVAISLGQQFLPVGLINERDNFFSSNPPFMRRMFAESKGIDLGAVARVYPGMNEAIIIEGGIFSGRFVRQEDRRAEDPDLAPRVASFKSRSAYHEVFATYFEHDLAAYDPLRAFGSGFEFKLPRWRGLELTLLAEFWTFEQFQRLGPNQETRAHLLYGEASWWKLVGGYRFSEARGRMISSTSEDDLPIETSKLGFFGVNVTENFGLRAERVIETQSEVSRNEWVGRALVHWSH